MSMADTVQRYFDAWNAHDADAIVATFADRGTYEDPSTAGALSGADIGANAAALWAAFPERIVRAHEPRPRRRRPVRGPVDHAGDQLGSVRRAAADRSIRVREGRGLHPGG